MESIDNSIAVGAYNSVEESLSLIEKTAL